MAISKLQMGTVSILLIYIERCICQSGFILTLLSEDMTEEGNTSKLEFQNSKELAAVNLLSLSCREMTERLDYW